MRKIVVLTFISLDGVMQAPGGPEEDTSGDFKFGGWTVPFFNADEVGGAEMGKQMSMPFDLLLGRKTFDIFQAYWPNKDDEIGKIFNKVNKYVVSNEPIENDWPTTIPISGSVVAGLKKLKGSDGPMLQVHGSGDMIQTLLENDLVDELWLKIFPITLGKGKKLFDRGTKPANYKLINSKITPSGVIFANYQRDGDVKTGTFD